MSADPLFARVMQRMRWRHALPWLLRGVAAGIAAAAIILVAGRVVGWDGAAWWASGSVLLLTLGGALVAWLTRPAPAAALGRADRLLGLHNRLTTAWEYGGGEAPILRLQRADLQEQAARLDVRAGLPLTPPRREAVAPAGAIVLLLVALLLPAPGGRAAGTRPATHARIAHAAARLAAVQQAASHLQPQQRSALSRADRQRQAQIARVLARLQKELAAARTPAQALRAIARAQDALNRLGNTQAAAQKAALAKLSATLSRNASTRALANTLRQGKPGATAAAARKLAANVDHMTVQQRADMARALQAAANAAAADPALSSSLQNAATSLAQGDTAGAKAALAKAGQQAASDQAAGAQQAALDKANAALDDARNEVTGQSSSPAPSGKGSPSGSAQAAGRSSGAKSGQSGTKGNAVQSSAGGSKGQGAAGKGAASGQGQGAGTGTGQGQGQGNGQGTGQGQGAGQGAGQGQGSGSGQGQGSGGQGTGRGAGGGRGGSGGSGNSGNASGSQVFIPAPQGSGPSSTTNGSKGQATRGSLRPWRAVLPQYARSARASLESSNLPPDERTLVKRYFDQLSH